MTEHIDNARGQEVTEGPPGIAYRPQQGGAKIIKHGSGHSQKIDAQIQRRKIQDFRRGLHPDQNGPGEAYAYKRQGKPTDQAEQHGGVDRLPQFLIGTGSPVPGGQNIGADGETDEQIHQQIDDRGVGAHGSQGIITGETAYHHDVSRVEQQL